MCVPHYAYPPGTRLPPQQRQRLSRAVERVDAPVPRRGNQEPPELSRLAPHAGGTGKEGYARSDDPRSYRIWAISTTNAIIATTFDLALLGGRALR